MDYIILSVVSRSSTGADLLTKLRSPRVSTNAPCTSTSERFTDIRTKSDAQLLNLMKMLSCFKTSSHCLIWLFNLSVQDYTVPNTLEILRCML